MKTIEEVMARTGPEGECIVWRGYITPRGYGQWAHGLNQPFLVHRFVYEQTVGPIPDGLVIDHLCRNRDCCNPEHLEAVTERENILRGVSFSAVNARKTHCKWGHEFTPENTYFRSGRGGRECRTCTRVKWRKRRAEAS